VAGERYLRLAEVIRLHQRIVATSGGAAAIRDLGALEAAVAQPRATFDGVDLYVGLAAKGERSRTPSS
jgi:death-on-curing protein